MSAGSDVTLDRRSLSAFADQLDPSTVHASIAEANQARQDHAFTVLVLASLHRGIPVDAGVLIRGAALLPDSEILAAVAGKVTGDVVGALLAALDDRGLGPDREPAALLIAVLLCRRMSIPRPPALGGEIRIRARRVLSQEGEDAMVAIQGILDDPDLASLLEGLLTNDIKDAARVFTAKLVDRLMGPVLSGFPERAPKAAKVHGSVRRAVQKIGRNDACWCGSGKKYKSCHEKADRERNADSSDVEGLTASELSADLERHLDLARLQALKGHELARLDPLRVPDALRTRWIELLGSWGEHVAALRAVKAWMPGEPRPTDAHDDLDEQIRFVAENAARTGQVAIVGEAMTLRGGRTDEILPEARLLAVPPEERFRLLESIALEELDGAGVDLGFALLQIGYPALGIHVARSELVLRKRDGDTDALHATMVEARDKLGAPPWDPIDDVLHLLDRGVDPEFEAQLADSRRRMSEREAALQATQDALGRVRDELQQLERSRSEARPVVVEARPKAQPAGEDPAVKELRERLEKLKVELNDRHRERNTLRKELEQTREKVATLEARPEEEEDEPEEDEDDGPGLDVSVASRIRLPRWPDGFQARLEEVPEATARAALMRVAELCAGLMFREVRPLRGFADTWRVKVGRSYRLLFRPVDDTLEVLDLLHRQDLEKRLFRLRRGGE